MTLGIPARRGLWFKAAFEEAVLGVLDRLVLSDVAGERMAPLIIGRPDQKGSTCRDNRMFVEGVLWTVRTGSPWHDLPEAFGGWIVDSTIIRAHQHAAGAKKGGLTIRRWAAPKAD